MYVYIYVSMYVCIVCTKWIIESVPLQKHICISQNSVDISDPFPEAASCSFLIKFNIFRTNG